MIGESVRTGLQQDGFAVDWVQDGRAAELALETGAYETLLLDLGLPRKTGLEVLASLRRRGDAIPVLILTARDAVADRVKGLDAGADDYLVKPFDLEELAARVRALLRRKSGRADPVVQVGGLSHQPGDARSVAGREIDLAVRARVRLDPCPRRAARSGVFARATRGKALRLGPGGGKQYRGGVHPFPAPKTGYEVIQNVRGVGYMVPNLHEFDPAPAAAVVAVRVSRSPWSPPARESIPRRCRSQRAVRLPPQTNGGSLPSNSFGPLPPSSVEEMGSEDGFVVQIWDRNGLELYFSRPASKLPQRAELGFSTVSTPRGSWRVYSALEHNNVVQVAQPMSVRRDLAAGMALDALVPLLLLLPVLGILIWLASGADCGPWTAWQRRSTGARRTRSNPCPKRDCRVKSGRWSWP